MGFYDFAKSARIRSVRQARICPSEGKLKWMDSVTVKPRSELLQTFTRRAHFRLRKAGECGMLSVTGTGIKKQRHLGSIS